MFLRRGDLDNLSELLLEPLILLGDHLYSMNWLTRLIICSLLTGCLLLGGGVHHRQLLILWLPRLLTHPV